MAGAHVLYAKSWASPVRYGDAGGGGRAARARLRDWCVDESWFAGARPECRFMHCLPVRRNVVVADEVLDGPRSVGRAARRTTACGRRWRCCTACLRTEVNRDERRRTAVTPSWRALRARRSPTSACSRARPSWSRSAAAPCEPRRRRCATCSSRSRSCTSSASASSWCTAAAPQASALPRALGGEPRFVEGRRVTDEKALEVAAMVAERHASTPASSPPAARSGCRRSASPASTPG